MRCSTGDAELAGWKTRFRAAVTNDVALAERASGNRDNAIDLLVHEMEVSPLFTMVLQGDCPATGV